MSKELSITELFRESHHAVARMLAIGMSLSMIRQRTGRSARSISLLLADPSFQELIAIYSERVDEKWEEVTDRYLDLGISNMIRAESLIADKLEADDEVPITVLDKISQGRADRFGYSKNSTLRVEHDFASALDKAISRSDKARVIEHQPPQGEGQLRTQPQPALERPKGPTQATQPLASHPLSDARVRTGHESVRSFSGVLENQGAFKRRRVA